MKYLRRQNDQEKSVPLQTSLEDFRKQKFKNTKIGAGVTKLNPPEPQLNNVKPLLNREELAFLNKHGDEDDFPIKTDSAR